MRFLLLIFFLGITFTVLSQPITVKVVKPTVLVGDTAVLQVQVSSANQLLSVNATVGSIQTALTYNSVSKYFEGTLQLTSFTQGDSLQFNFTATDYLNNSQTVSKKVLYDAPPIISVVRPLTESVARPVVQFKVFCSDKDSCNLTVSFDGAALQSFKMKDSLQSSLDLSAYNGLSGNLIFTVSDPQKQTGSASVVMYIDSSSLLTEIFAADTKIFDFNYNKILVSGALVDNALAYPRIIDINSKQQSIIPLKISLAPTSALSPFGAVLAGVDSSLYPKAPAFKYGYDWNNQTLTTLGQLNSALSLKVAGMYAAWSNAAQLSLRNLQTKTNMVINNAGNTQNDITDKGTLAYWTTNYNIAAFKNNNITVLTDNAAGKMNTYPLTDGTNFVFRKHVALSDFSLWWINDTLNKELAYFAALQPDPGRSYQVNNNTIAYLKPIANSTNLWLLDKTGSSQLTFFGDQNIAIENLNDNAQVILTRNSKRYLASKSVALKQLCSNLGQTYYRDSAWFITIGRMLYKLNTNVKVNNAQLTALKKNGVVELKWKAPVSNLTNFIVEKTTTHDDFVGFASIPAGLQTDYVFSDNSFSDANTIYRVRMMAGDSTYTYTNTARVVTPHNYSISINPNFAGNELTIKINSPESQQISIEIINSSGITFRTLKVSAAVGENIYKIDTSRFSLGYYWIKTFSSIGTNTVKFLKL